jgi:hypothetical protein
MSTDDWGTPEWLRRYFAEWDDPCPLGGADNGGDGLLRDWGDPTFANIPYSRGNVERWIDKAILEARKGKRIVLLVRVDTSTRWWLKLTANGARFAPFFGRISFSGKEGGSPNFASALVFL